MTISLLSGLSLEAVDEIDVEDFVALSEAVSDFLPGTTGQPLGEA
jgi:hypothetical protein